MAYELSQNAEGFWVVDGVSGYFSEQVAQQVQANMRSASAETAAFLDVEEELRSAMLRAQRPPPTGAPFAAVRASTNPGNSAQVELGPGNGSGYTAAGAGPTKTLTATANQAISTIIPNVDPALAVGDRILYAGRHPDGPGDNSLRPHRGIYTITALGSGAAPWVLTRAADLSSTAHAQADREVYIESGDLSQQTFRLSLQNELTSGLDENLRLDWTDSNAASWMHWRYGAHIEGPFTVAGNPESPSIADPDGGATVDAEARASLVEVLGLLRGIGFIKS